MISLEHEVFYFDLMVAMSLYIKSDFDLIKAFKQPPSTTWNNYAGLPGSTM